MIAELMRQKKSNPKGILEVMSSKNKKNLKIFPPKPASITKLFSKSKDRGIFPKYQLNLHIN